MKELVSLFPMVKISKKNITKRSALLNGIGSVFDFEKNFFPESKLIIELIQKDDVLSRNWSAVGKTMEGVLVDFAMKSKEKDDLIAILKKHGILVKKSNRDVVKKEGKELDIVG